MQLQEYIHTYFEIASQEVNKIAVLFQDQSIKKGAFWIKKDTYNSPLSFIKTGYLRFSAYDQNSQKEITQWIATPGGFLGDLSSLVFDTPIRWNIEALSDCQLHTISNSNYQKIGQLIPQWEALEKRFIAKCFISLENRIFQLLSLSAEERYDHLFEQDPDLFNAVPLQYIASMLHMSPETLSRIRKRKTS
jgi:CRP-like cAMP-binding protein